MCIRDRYKAWQLLGSIGQEKSPYENVLREVAADLETLNKSLRALNASIGHYIDRLTHCLLYTARFV